MQIMRMIAYALVITGALVWGFVGLFNYNIVASIFGDATIFSRIIYSLVALGGLVLLLTANHEECYCDCSETDTRY